METHTQNKKQIALGLFLLGLLLFGGYLLLAKIWDVFSSIDPKLGAGLVAASATILVSVFTVLVSKHLERKAEILAHLREKKIPTYEKIINFIFSLTFAEKLGKKQPSENEMIKFMAEITQELVIWGSDEMLEAFYKFRMMSIENADGNSNNPYAVLFMVEDLLLAIRKDLGHKNKNISRGKILGLFVNDLPNELK
ncbi:hypothetical protein [Nitrosomonas ureae]|uniref:Uncharacterized protein n=1 Tax=Nitrosomonas ureae TaxID=44577 RepID=A0A1H2FYU2_9PROT|nr:hypothetical protein [Nitrosomonas ureae]ALQ51457.1 hypothetical protein ATY38_09645 [Nitrosomonas ureae]SDU12493.1 hypothetical protein SAMN05216406_12611 [Nitrosomonas ureae]